MSSAPSGLDVREYVYHYLDYTASDALFHVISTQRKWLITKIQFFNGSTTDNAEFFFPDFSASTSIIQPGGCLILEPNGAQRGDVSILGNAGGARIIIEFWFQAVPSGNSPPFSIVPP